MKKKDKLIEEDVKMEEDDEDVGQYGWPDENEDDDEEMKVNNMNDLTTYIPHSIDEIESMIEEIEKIMAYTSFK